VFAEREFTLVIIRDTKAACGWKQNSVSNLFLFGSFLHLVLIGAFFTGCDVLSCFHLFMGLFIIWGGFGGS
jgi:hypothetical protein